MNTFELLAQLEQGEKAAVTYVLGQIDQDDVNAIAKDDLAASPAKYTGADAQATLASDTFNDSKHLLRGKIQAAVDAAWQLEDVRTPIRLLANQAAQTALPTNAVTQPTQPT